MTDFIGTAAELPSVICSVRRPTLVMHPGAGYSADAVRESCWRLPVERRFPFFVSTWSANDSPADTSGITLAASDF
jgi:hypothetical protein